MKKATTAAVFVAILSVAGCTDNDARGNAGSEPARTESQASQGVDDGDPTTRSIGQTVTLRDTEGHPMQVTLTGIAYRDAFAKDKTLALPGKYALAIAFTMKSKAGGMLGEQTDNGIKWEQGADTAEGWDYTDAPWKGCIDAHTPYAEIEANREYKAITDMNVPTKGGTLIIEDDYGSVARWQLPEADSGSGTEPATRYTTEDC
ncbi:hypothetical protein OG384_14620 [Streptomyces sp. NBC_01324]|uniref:hypothetical protein n=1 Tax=Streptomyces sp. NBC_01324 TaxID=2903826 RepID=UPI002E13E80B|nr:hypothetical protein OG384_14620 [Streptomyces sp. NBC_01324]